MKCRLTESPNEPSLHNLLEKELFFNSINRPSSQFPSLVILFSPYSSDRLRITLTREEYGDMVEVFGVFDSSDETFGRSGNLIRLLSRQSTQQVSAVCTQMVR